MSILDGKREENKPEVEGGLFSSPGICTRDEETMVNNTNVSKSIADFLRRAKMPKQTFETDAWYTGNGTKKGKEDDFER